MQYSIVEPAGTKKSSRLAPYFNGVQHEHLSISVQTTALYSTLANLRTLLLNTEGVYWLRDGTLHIYHGSGTDHTSTNNTMGCWVNIKGISHTAEKQLGGKDLGTITLECTVALDGTGSTYAGPW